MRRLLYLITVCAIPFLTITLPYSHGVGLGALLPLVKTQSIFLGAFAIAVIVSIVPRHVAGEYKPFVALFFLSLSLAFALLISRHLHSYFPS